MNLRAFYKGDKIIKLMRLKLFYPFEYMDSLGNFEETKLPPKNAFYSELYMKGIIDEDYNINMYSKFAIPWRKRQ